MQCSTLKVASIASGAKTRGEASNCLNCPAVRGGGFPTWGGGGGKGEGEEGGKLLTLVDTKLMVRMVATTAVTPNNILQKVVKKLVIFYTN